MTDRDTMQRAVEVSIVYHEGQKMFAVPDPIHHTDTSESLEYIQGWNDCRAEMLAEQPDLDIE